MKLQGMGLVCTGSVTQSFLARMPALLARLGPVKASSFRVGRQISRSLRAGQSASHFSALETCPVVWFAMPETMLERALSEFATQTPIHKTMVVLCDCERQSSRPGMLSRTGARVASLNAVPEFNERLFIAEGHPDTLRAIRRLTELEDRKLIELQSGMKPLFFAGTRFAAPLLLPWIAAAVESLRLAGFTRAEAAAVGENIGIRTLYRYTKAGPRAWNRKTAASLRHGLEHDLETIRGRDRRLSEIYEQGIRIALAKF
ncbi:MAG: hypothetical protein JO307_32405 [Bryobacterales bacterium]|nr:hypothetical protein [Bryobacterales bacterium]MBV9396437.1 hypothetical protein [Bryobacterales bacterium]